jgi:2'-5' RNA ligase
MTPAAASSKTRLFVGTFLSSQQQDLLGKLKTDKLSELWHKKIRFVKADKLHMTWIFLGDIDVDSIGEIGRLLKESLTGAKAFSVIYSQHEFFRDRGKPRSLVLTPQAIPDELASMAGQIREVTAPFATKNNHHDRFHPHITLLRIETDHAKAADKSKSGLEMPPWWNIQEALPLKHDVDNVCLIESHLDDGAYRVIAKFELIKQ